MFISSICSARKASRVVHHIRALPVGDEVSGPVLGQSGHHGSQDLGVFSGGVEILQLCSLAGALVGGGGGRDAVASASYKKSFTILIDSTIDMVTKELIQKEIELFPEPYLEEILDFIHFLKGKASRDKSEAAILSESVLAKDWLSAEEDEAWKDL